MSEMATAWLVSEGAAEASATAPATIETATVKT